MSDIGPVTPDNPHHSSEENDTMAFPKWYQEEAGPELTRAFETLNDRLENLEWELLLTQAYADHAHWRLGKAAEFITALTRNVQGQQSTPAPAQQRRQQNPQPTRTHRIKCRCSKGYHSTGEEVRECAISRGKIKANA